MRQPRHFQSFALRRVVLRLHIMFVCVCLFKAMCETVMAASTWTWNGRKLLLCGLKKHIRVVKCFQGSCFVHFLCRPQFYSGFCVCDVRMSARVQIPLPSPGTQTQTFTSFSGRWCTSKFKRIFPLLSNLCELFVPGWSHFEKARILIHIKAHKTCLYLRLALSLHHGAGVRGYAPQKMSVCHLWLDLPHADRGHVKAGECEQELSVNWTRD